MTTAQEGGRVVSLTHRPHLPPGNSPGTHFFQRLSRPQGHSAIGRIMSMKNSKDTIWDRTATFWFVVQHRNIFVKHSVSVCTCILTRCINCRDCLTCNLMWKRIRTISIAGREGTLSSDSCHCVDIDLDVSGAKFEEYQVAYLNRVRRYEFRCLP